MDAPCARIGLRPLLLLHFSHKTHSLLLSGTTQTMERLHQIWLYLEARSALYSAAERIHLTFGLLLCEAVLYWAPGVRTALGSEPPETSLEDLFARLLDEYGIFYERQKVIGRYHIDFYLPVSNTVIEIQGCYSYNCPRDLCLINEMFKANNRYIKWNSMLIADVNWESDF